MNSRLRNYILTVLFTVTLGAGIAATIVGLSIPSSVDAALPKYVAWLLILTAVLYVVVKLTRGAVVLTASASIVIIAMLTGNIWPVFVSLWFAASSLILGRLVLRWLGIDYAETGMATAFLTGAGTFATVIGLMAHFGVNYFGVYCMLLLLPFFAGWRIVNDSLGHAIEKLSVNEARDGFLSAAIIAIALFHFGVALLPEFGFDALAMHLFIPHYMASNHKWGFDPNLYSWALMPMNANWMYSIGYMLAGETAARLINVTFVMVMALLGRELVVWGGGGDKGAKWTMLVFLSTPLTYTETNSLFVDAVWSAYMLAGALWFFRYFSSELETGHFVEISGIAFGFAAASKAVTFVNLPVFFIILLYRWRSLIDRKVAVPLLKALMIFLILGMVPYITAWNIAANPVFPFYNEIFKSPFYPEVNFDNSLFKSGSHWDLPYRILFDSGKYLEASNGASGFQWLILLFPAVIILLANKSYKGALLFVVGVVMVILTFQTQSYLRYVFPSFLMLSAVIGIALSSNNVFGKFSSILPLVAAVTVVMNLLFITSGTWAHRDIQLNVLWDHGARDQYIEMRVPVRRAVELTNYLNPRSTPVAMFTQPFGAGLNGDALYPNWYNYRFQEAVNRIDEKGALVKLLSGYGVRFVLLDSTWGDVEKRMIIEATTDNIAEFGSVSVRQIKPEYMHPNELLKNPDFNSRDGWALSPGVEYNAELKTMRVSVNSSAWQSVSVREGVYYLNTVKARCVDEPAKGRLQVNWANNQGQYMSSDIKVFECTNEWAEYTMEIIPPDNAAIAIVHTIGQSSAPLEFNENSLKK